MKWGYYLDVICYTSVESNKPVMGFRLPMWLYVCSCILQTNICGLKMFSPNYILCSPAGDVPSTKIWIVYKEFRISVLWLYVKRMIMLTKEEYTLLIHSRHKPFLITDIIFEMSWCSKLYMVWHLTTFAVMLPWLLMLMIIIPEARQNESIYITKHTKEICKCNFAYDGCLLWNGLPD